MAQERPELSMEAFRVLAAQAGLDPDDPSLGDLLPDVRLMLERTAKLEGADVEGLEPLPFSASMEGL